VPWQVTLARGLRGARSLQELSTILRYDLMPYIFLVNAPRQPARIGLDSADRMRNSCVVTT
jgi:hypothetical protein